MKLKDWREANGRSVEDVAAVLECTRQAVYNYERPLEDGGRLPDAKRLELVGEMTAGEVTPNDWFDVDRWRSAGGLALVGAPAAEAA